MSGQQNYGPTTQIHIIRDCRGCDMLSFTFSGTTYYHTCAHPSVTKKFGEAQAFGLPRNSPSELNDTAAKTPSFCPYLKETVIE